MHTSVLLGCAGPGGRGLIASVNHCPAVGDSKGRKCDTDQNIIYYFLSLLFSLIQLQLVEFAYPMRMNG